MVKLNKKGFTLAELLIVVAVIAVLVAVAIPTFSNQLEKSRQAVDVSNLRGAYAAARVAELNGNVSGVEFYENQRNMKVGTEDTAKAEKFYTAYWYDPDSGDLLLMPTETTGSAGSEVTATKSVTATERFSTKSQFGRSQSETVLTELTSGLPKSVIYTDAQHKVVEEDTENEISAVRAGTVDRAIRIVFYRTKSSTFKIHEIAYVATADEPLVRDGSDTGYLKVEAAGSDTIAITLTNENKTMTPTSTDLTELITVTADNLPVTEYTITASDDTLSDHKLKINADNELVKDGNEDTAVAVSTDTTNGDDLPLKISYTDDNGVVWSGTITLKLKITAG